MKVLDCHLHDYVELICVYKIEVVVDMQDGTQETGIADDIRTQAGQESLCLRKGDGLKYVPLLGIEEIRSVKDNPHFKSIRFV